MAYLSREELSKIGFASFGQEVFISDKVSIYNASKITIGSYVRIDDFCLLSAGDGGIEIGNYVHISCYACLIGREKITIHDFVAISIKASILSSTSDYSGDTLPSLKEFENMDESDTISSVISMPVVLETHTGIGAHTVVLPGVTIGKGSGVGANSVVYESLNEWGVYVGNPVRFIKKRTDVVYKKTQELFNKDKEKKQ